MKTVYAYQIPPEYQQSPLARLEIDLPEMWPEITLTGGGRCAAFETDLFQTAERWEKAADEYINGEEWTAAPVTIRKALENYGIEKQNGKQWSPRELGAWKRLFQDWDRNPWRDDDARTAEALDLMTGRKWDYKPLRGCSQGDYITAFFPVDKYNRKDLDRLEIEYFNLGEEWKIRDEPEGVEGADEFYMYCYSWDPDEKKIEIAVAAGEEDLEKIEMHPFAGWSRRPVYA